MSSFSEIFPKKVGGGGRGAPLHTALAPIVRKLDSAIHQINRYPVNKSKQNTLRYPLDSELSGG